MLCSARTSISSHIDKRLYQGIFTVVFSREWHVSNPKRIFPARYNTINELNVGSYFSVVLFAARSRCSLGTPVASHIRNVPDLDGLG